MILQCVDDQRNRIKSVMDLAEKRDANTIMVGAINAERSLMDIASFPSTLSYESGDQDFCKFVFQESH